jgi:hypothetical protein
MYNGIALIQTRTFWSAGLALLAVIASQFQWTSVLGFATNPDSVNEILSGVGAVGAFLAIVFRALATKKVTTALPTAATSKISAQAWPALLLLFSLALGGCLSTTVSQAQLDAARATYDSAFLTPAARYRQLGYCATGTTATLARPCADRATVAKLRAVDGQIHAAFTALQSEVTAGGGSTVVSDFSALQSLISGAETLIASLGVK